MSSIRVMSYNICHYNNDIGTKGFPPEIIDEKVTNLKTMLMENAPDLIGLQEDWTYLDKKETIKSATGLFSPVYRFIAGTGDHTLRSKFKAVPETHKLVKFSTGRYYRRCMFIHPETKKTILLITCHPSAYDYNVSKRKIEYNELFRDIKALTYDLCIVTGDFNTVTGDDKKLLKDLCTQNEFSMAIGSYLPWIPTCLGHDGKARNSYDNILVSKGATIQTVRVLTEWYDRLYSDHVPLFANIVL